MITVTAPGNGVLPADPRTGVVPRRRAARWNETAPLRWRGLWAVSSQRARRRAKALGIDWRMLARVWEPQRRGLLHVHLVLPFGTAEERECTYIALGGLLARRHEFGFGFVDRGPKVQVAPGVWDRRLPVIPVAQAANYVSKYLTHSAGEKGSLLEVARRRMMVGPILHVATPLKRASGVSMRSLRLRRAVLARAGGSCESLEEWERQCQLHALERGVMPLDPWTDVLIRSQWRDDCSMAVVDVSDGQVIEPTPAPPPRALTLLPQRARSEERVDLLLRLELVTHRDVTTPFQELRIVVLDLQTRVVALAPP